MAELLAQVFHLGSWKSIKEMEESITLDELYLLIEANNKAEHRHNKFAAALKGVKLPDPDEGEDFDRIKQRAEAALMGKTEDAYVLEDVIGFDIKED